MPRFLSPEWIDALDRAAAVVEAPAASLVVQYVVTDDDRQPVAYHLTTDAGAWRVRTGRVENPDVVLTLDRDTAREVARAQMSAQAAFMTGRLRIGGDPLALVRHRDDVARLDECFRVVGDATEW